MDTAWQRYADVATGFTQMAQRRAEQVVRALVRRGEVEASRREKTVEDLLARVDPVRRLGLARRSDVDRLQDKVSRLEATIHNLGGTGTGSKPSGAQRAAKPPRPDTTEPMEGEPS
ncbi:MAG: hypothetical protein ACRDYX_13775 [Egibacteraceae bacterium]